MYMPNVKIKNKYQTFNNRDYLEVDFQEAIYQYNQGRTIECRILDENGCIVEWEKYNKCNGLENCVEFDEIINGQWFVKTKGY